MAAPNPAFQYLLDLYTGGEYGASYGDEAYGGSASPPYFIPAPVDDSDDLQASRNYHIAELQTKRLGLVISNRKWDEKRQWQLFWNPIPTLDIDELLGYQRIRKFRVLPFGDPTGLVIVVRWLDLKKPKRLRGDWWTWQCLLEEV